MAERHARMAKEAAMVSADASSSLDTSAFPATEPMYYSAVYQPTFDAQVLGCMDSNERGPHGSTHAIVLNTTLFYPEGGGQEGDRGTLTQGDVSFSVLDTQKFGEVIVHFTDGPLEEGKDVQGALDWMRRKQLMDHHTAVQLWVEQPADCSAPTSSKRVLISRWKVVDWTSRISIV